MNKILIHLICLIFFKTAFGQEDKNSCLSTVLEYNKKLSQIDQPKSGQVYYIDYQQEISYWDADTKPVNTRVKYYISSDQLHVISGELKLYMDKTYVFTIIEKQKQIILSRNPETTKDEASISLFYKNQESVIKSCKVSECSYDKVKGLTKIVLDAKDVNVEGVEIESMTYYFKKNSGQLVKTITNYTKNYPIRRMSISYNELNFNSNYKFPSKLSDMFLDSNGELKSKYNGYQLIKE